VSTAVLQKHLNEELKLVCLLQLFSQVADNSLSLPCSKKSVRIAGLCHAVLDSANWCLTTAFSALTLLVPAHLGSPGHRAVKRVCVCICCLARPEVGHHRWLSSFYSPTLHTIPGVFSVFREIPSTAGLWRRRQSVLDEVWTCPRTPEHSDDVQMVFISSVF